ncbi:MAG: hypothetical protein U0168_15015 [Nannocystaceae bacterium]
MSTPSKLRRIAPLALGLAVAQPACAGSMGNNGPSQAPMSNVFLRNSFDTDPSIYLGRFVPRNATDIDEGSAMPLTCSQYVKYRFIEGGGVKFTEHMAVSTEVAARIGVPVIASANASASKNREVKVEYTLTGKMVADITDPAAFEQCCKEKPDQCTDRFIGEFLQGTGAVYREDSSAAQIQGQGTNPTNGVSGAGQASREKSWTQAIEFPNPVYFAFKVTQTPNNRATSSCGPWVDAPPSEPGFVFFVGTSREMKNERTARDRAGLDLKMKAYASVATPAAPNPDGSPNPAAMENQAAQRWAMGAATVESCVEIVQSPKGPRYIGRVLGKLPEYKPGAVAPATPSTTTPTQPGTPTIDIEVPTIPMEVPGAEDDGG